MGKKTDYEVGSSKEDTFWYWINERHRIYLRKEVDKKPPPWTTDPVLQEWKFTNCFRELDRGTLTLNQLQPTGPKKTRVVNVILYRMINLAETFLATGLMNDTQDLTQLFDKLQQRKEAGHVIFTAAHLTYGEPGREKLDSVMDTVVEAWNDATLIDDMFAENTLEHAFNVLLARRDLIGIGKFIGYEMVTDFRHMPELWKNGAPTDVNTWANIGPGSERGMLRLGWDPSVETMQYLLERAKTQLESHVLAQTWPPFELREIEHSLCEFDKYERTRLGQSRPKQRYAY